MENLLEKKSHPCKICLISMICIEPCEMYSINLSVLNSLSEYLRAMNSIPSSIDEVNILIDKQSFVVISQRTITFFKNGKPHRKDKPAIISCDGSREYWFDGKLHRDGDKPSIIDPNGTMKYFKHGKLHRKNNPAVIMGRIKKYYENGLLHRKKGPAVIHPDRKEYWKYGEYIKTETTSMSSM